MIEVLPLTWVVLSILWGSFLFSTVLDCLNVSHQTDVVPDALRDVVDRETLERSGNYLREQTRLSILKQFVVTLTTTLFLLFGGFRWAESLAVQWSDHEMVRGMLFVGILLFLSFLVSLPFSYVSTFRVEQRFGFNQSTRKLWVVDILKGILIGTLLGGGLLAAVLGFLELAGPSGWLWAWLALVVFQLFLLYVAPVVILPLFNQYTPLPEGELRSAIEHLSQKLGFECSGIFTMDGSKRSSKTNAFFTGFGKARRIVLFDTLVKHHSTDELLAVLAHEIGHYKKNHIWRQTLVSIASSLVMFYFFSLVLKNQELTRAFGLERVTVYSSLVFFLIFYTPCSAAVGLLSLIMSRKYEYEADAFSLAAYPKPKALIQALKKLSMHNLSNVNPHPVCVFFEYSHPPVVARINSIESRLKVTGN